MSENKNIVASVKASELKKNFQFTKIPPGMYKFQTRSLESKDKPSSSLIQFELDYWIDIVKDELQSDEILDLKSVAYTTAVKELESFLAPNTKASYDLMGFLYKRSWLFHGIPGTGKSVLVKRFANEIVKKGGIVFTNLSSVVGSDFNKYFDPVNQAQLMCIIIEEFEGIQDTSHILTALDGGIQRNNTIFLCTTNHLNQIPPRMLRPGRIHSKIEVGPLELEGRLHYLRSKIEDDKLATVMAELSHGLVIDEMKELIQQTILMGRSPELVVADLLDFRKTAKTNFYDPKNDPTITKALIYNK